MYIISIPCDDVIPCETSLQVLFSVSVRVYRLYFDVALKRLRPVAPPDNTATSYFLCVTYIALISNFQNTLPLLKK